MNRDFDSAGDLTETLMQFLYAATNALTRDLGRQATTAETTGGGSRALESPPPQRPFPEGFRLSDFALRFNLGRLFLIAALTSSLALVVLLLTHSTKACVKP